MPGNTLASRTMNLNFVNLLACIELASDWFKNNQLLSELTHEHYREPVPLKGHSQLMHMRISYHFLAGLADLHIIR